MQTRLPHSAENRRDLTFVKLLRRVYPRRQWGNAFEGKLLKPGSRIDDIGLWPAPDYPKIPLLLEYAGNDHTGRGHNRSNDIYILWRYESASGDWSELIRSIGQGIDWVYNLRPVALRELARTARPVDVRTAGTISGRVLELLDNELELLSVAERHLVMSFVYQAFSARRINY